MNHPARPHDPLIEDHQVIRTNQLLARLLVSMRTITASILVFFLAVPLSQAADAFQGAQQQQEAEAIPPAPAPAPPASATPPDAPTPNVAAQSSDSQQGSQPANTQQGTAPARQQPGAPPSLGTAAAPVENPVGVPGSKPAGAVIAPAKQRRTRSFAIRIAILVGVAVGVGTVVALSNASPSRPH